jgi:hypothetical protein
VTFSDHPDQIFRGSFFIHYYLFEATTICAQSFMLYFADGMKIMPMQPLGRSATIVIRYKELQS